MLHVGNIWAEGKGGPEGPPGLAEASGCHFSSLLCRLGPALLHGLRDPLAGLGTHRFSPPGLRNSLLGSDNGRATTP